MEKIAVENMFYNSGKLNNQQIRMIQLFEQPFSEEEFAKVNEVVVGILAKRIDEEMERLEKERGWTKETYEQWANEHMRTPYLDKP